MARSGRGRLHAVVVSVCVAVAALLAEGLCPALAAARPASAMLHRSASSVRAEAAQARLEIRHLVQIRHSSAGRPATTLHPRFLRRAVPHGRALRGRAGRGQATMRPALVSGAAGVTSLTGAYPQSKFYSQTVSSLSSLGSTSLTAICRSSAVTSHFPE